MSGKTKMEKSDTSEGKGRQHRGKFTEGLLDCEVILKALHIRPGQTILDAGCGNGYMSKLFSNEVTQSGKVYALDQDRYFIKALKNETQGTNIETTKELRCHRLSDWVKIMAVFTIFMMSLGVNSI